MKSLKYIGLALFLSISLIGKSSPNIKVDSVEILINRYQYQRALILVDRLISTSKPTANLFYQKGTILKGLFNYNQAVDFYLKAFALDSTNNQVAVELASTYKQLPDHEKALKFYALALKNDPQNTMLKIEVANCHYYMDEYKPAITNFSRIYRDDTTNYFVIKRLASCYSKLERADSSIFYYRKAIELNPSDANNISNICNQFIGQRKYNEGIKTAQSYIAIDSLNDKINSLNAYLYLLAKKYDTSITKFSYCLQNGDSSRFVMRSMSIAYFKSDSFDTAKFYLEKAYQQDTTDISTLHILGISCSQSYYKELGIKYLEKAIALYDPTINDYALIYRNLLESCRAWSNCPCEKNLAVAIKAMELNPTDTILIYHVAASYDRCMNDKEKAMEYYVKYLDTKPPINDPTALTINNYTVAEHRLADLRKEMKKKKK